MIDRILKSEVIESLNNQPVVAILGPRQCGKSTLSKQIIALRKDVVYIDAEKEADRLKLSDPEIFFELNRGKLVCIDEIQRLPDLFVALRSEIDSKRVNGRFLILGSASKDLIKQSSETLAGRIAYLQLTTFLFTEIESVSELNIFWNRGGFPGSFLSVSDKTSFVWRQNFIQTFLERDIPQLGFSISAETIRRLWNMLAHHHGQILNLSTLGSSLGFSHTTIRNYLDLLSETFMIRLLSPYHSNMGKRVVRTPKVYLRDHGILNCLLKITSFDELLGHPVKGASWEGLVIENLIGIAQNWDAFFYRTSVGAELDLILTFGSRIIAVECKATKSPKLTSGFWNAIEDVKPDETWVVAPFTDSYPLKKDVWIMSLPDAMKKLEEINRSLFE
jgi:uncharacterized protein